MPDPGMRDQEQFLQVVDRDEAENDSVRLSIARRAAAETVSLDIALGRVLAEDVVAPVDVPSFDRSNVDGFAVVAEDTFGAAEESRVSSASATKVIHTGVVPVTEIETGQAVSIATGGMVPRGADAVVMVEHADVRDGVLHVRRALSAGSGVSFAGNRHQRGRDRAACGHLLTSRDTGVICCHRS